MTVRTQDIRFSCAHCGQRIVVDASAAGVETTCPECKRPMIIPHDGMLVDQESVTAAAGRGNSHGRFGFTDGIDRGESLDREHTASRKELERLQEQLRTVSDEAVQLKARVAEATKQMQQAAEDLEVARERIKALEAEADAMQTRRAAAERELGEARAEIIRLQEESSLHRKNFDAARGKLADAETAAKRASALEVELKSAQEILSAAVENGRRLEEQCTELRAEAEGARRELLQTESGRELAALRERFAATEEEGRRLAVQLADAQSEVRRLTQSEREWRAQFDTMRRQRDDAQGRADAGSHSALQHGNDVLRGILDRQKSELDERYAELRRLRGAQLSLRILYAIGAVLFLAAIVIGLQALHGMWR